MTQENDGIASNGYYTAIPWKDVSTVAVFPSVKFTKFDAGVKLIKGHKGAITDVQFSPFAKQLLATSSEDSTIKLWVLSNPRGIDEHMLHPAAELMGHSKKVIGVQWHPIVNNMLASVS